MTPLTGLPVGRGRSLPSPADMLAGPLPDGLARWVHERSVDLGWPMHLGAPGAQPTPRLLGAATSNCLTANDWICGLYLRQRHAQLTQALGQHLVLTLESLLIGLVLAFPLALLARRSRAWDVGVTGVTTVVYTIPSLALFALLLPFTGLSQTTVLIGLTLYTLVILVRGIVSGLAAVPPDVLDAARGMGYSPVRLFTTVALPLALPTIAAALRVAFVSTVAITTIGSIVGYGGLGNLISDGVGSLFKAEVLTASVVCVLIAVAGDLAILGLVRLVTPWRRALR